MSTRDDKPTTLWWPDGTKTEHYGWRDCRLWARLCIEAWETERARPG